MLEPIKLIIPEDSGGLRLDLVLSKLLPDYSRSRLQTWIKHQFVTVSGQPADVRQKVWGGELVIITPQPSAEESAYRAQNIPIEIVFEDEHIVVINKPAGMVVHPAAGNWEGTLLNALLYHMPQVEEVPRAGIVHRLDKDTSGLLVVAKTISAQISLVKQLQARSVKREYRAIVWGIVHGRGKVDAAIGRDPHNRKKMAVVKHFGKQAITHFEALETFSYHSYIRCLLETGRTHQIRVHMQSINAPLVGDPVYERGGTMSSVKMSPQLYDAVGGFKRQALHAARLGLHHPVSGTVMQWQAALPEDMKTLLAVLHEDSRLALLNMAEDEDERWWDVSPSTIVDEDDGWEEDEE